MQPDECLILLIHQALLSIERKLSNRRNSGRKMLIYFILLLPLSIWFHYFITLLVFHIALSIWYTHSTVPVFF